MPHFIAESAIFQEAEVVSSKPGKAIFRMVMQTSDEVNQNRRMYPHSVLDEGMKACKPRIFWRIRSSLPNWKRNF